MTKKGLSPLLASIYLILVLVGLPALAAFAGQSPGSAPASNPEVKSIVWRLNSPINAERIEGVYLAAAVQEIYNRSNGRLKIDVYPLFSLGIPPTQTLRGMKDDACEILFSVAMYELGEEPCLGVTEIPGIWKSKQQSVDAGKATLEFRRKLFKENWRAVLLPFGNLITYWDETFLRDRPVKGLDDFKGLKIRTPNARYRAIYSALGASPQMMTMGDVYMAMKTGVVDGFASASCLTWEVKLYEVAKYGITMSANLAGVFDILVTDKAWAALPSDIQLIVRDVFAESGKKMDAQAVKPDTDRDYQAKCKGKGVEYAKLSEEDRVKYIGIATESAKEWIKSEGGRVAEAWEIIQPVLKRDYPLAEW